MIRIGGEMNEQAQNDAANVDLDAFSQGGPAIETPTAITDRMHALLSPEPTR
jgi:hypothetical protein